MHIRNFVFAAGLLAASLPSYAFKLIGDDEAKLPAAAAMTTRGITRGPAIRLVSPDPDAGAVKAPFNLKVAFQPHGGARIDPASVKVTYLKATPVNLLDRIKPGLTDAGIDLAGAEAPPGEHQIMISLQDSEGRKSNSIVVLKVAK